MKCKRFSKGDVEAFIDSRRAIFPQYFNDEKISHEEIEFLLEMANLAPSHKLTQPWRFKVIMGAALPRLGKFMAEYYKQSESSDQFQQRKYDKAIRKCEKSQAVILLCLQRDPKESIPEWEELAALSCAVQNLWLAASALGLGGYWSSSKVIGALDQFTSLEEGERCFGLFFLGHHDMPEVERKRDPLPTKVKWITD